MLQHHVHDDVEQQICIDASHVLEKVLSRFQLKNPCAFVICSQHQIDAVVVQIWCTNL